jgi:hypothetical protein
MPFLSILFYRKKPDFPKPGNMEEEVISNVEDHSIDIVSDIQEEYFHYFKELYDLDDYNQPDKGKQMDLSNLDLEK